jgi:uncharacterized delta-60 repeat protein
MLVARILIVLAMFLAPAWAAPGDLDPTFGTGGIVIEGASDPGLMTANGVVVQPDGLIVVAGGTGTAVLVRRYRSDGTPDPAFGTGGATTVTFGVGSVAATDVALWQDGTDLKIVVAGATSAGDMAVARLMPDGALDATFDGDGRTTIDFGSSDSAEAVAVQPDGRVVVAGTSGSSPFALARLDVGGSLDATFDGDGRVTTTLPGGCFGSCQPDRLLDLTLQQDGPDLKIVAVGEDVFAGSGSSFALARYMPNGSLDPSFGTGGIQTTFPTPTNLSRLSGVVIQPDGAIVTAGHKSPNNFDSVVARYLTSGALDGTFGSGGIATIDATPGMAPAGFDQLADVTLAPDGGIVATGFGRPLGTQSETTVVRLTATGVPDPGFGTGGIVVTPVAAADDGGRAIAIQPDGAIVVVGVIQNGLDSDLFVARYLGTGVAAVCGDAAVDPGEDCDDGNTDDGDCCSASCTFETTGSPCSDGDACTTGDSCDAGVCESGAAVTCALCESCDGIDGCVAAPATGCRTPTLPGKSSLQLKDKSPNTKDQAGWKWTKGEATTVGELGTPAGSDGYALCVFDAAGGLLFRMAAPAGGACGTASCWAALGGATPKGVRYRDGDAASDGVSTLIVKAGGAGQAKATLKAKGDHVPMPALGALDLPLRVQLRTDGGLCLESTFSAAGVIKNTAAEFKGKSD